MYVCLHLAKSFCIVCAYIWQNPPDGIRAVADVLLTSIAITHNMSSYILSLKKTYTFNTVNLFGDNDPCVVHKLGSALSPIGMPAPYYGT